MRRGGPTRDWRSAREKVEHEGLCRRCGSPYRLEAAHVIGRRCDPVKGKGRKVLADSVWPACAECHRAYDAHEIDILGLLTLDEQVQAVKDAGGIELARRRIIGREAA